MTGIVDAHRHIWRHADLPWLVRPMQPRIFVKSVHVQTNWAPERLKGNGR